MQLVADIRGNQYDDDDNDNDNDTDSSDNQSIKLNRIIINDDEKNSFNERIEWKRIFDNFIIVSSKFLHKKPSHRQYINNIVKSSSSSSSSTSSSSTSSLFRSVKTSYFIWMMIAAIFCLNHMSSIKFFRLIEANYISPETVLKNVIKEQQQQQQQHNIINITIIDTKHIN
ncbi:hypothetical protein DERF_009448 [Dermatophagoides farinae]|uniref:Uncharacterized protein n=1 Tax=Dermatophagoides farinae TaxID=6954 RepID=A0A922HV43_DERFA|nr:hypothetical protein DERF_009448 [Dermatophagoides farinae]